MSREDLNFVARVVFYFAVAVGLVIATLPELSGDGVNGEVDALVLVGPTPGVAEPGPAKGEVEVPFRRVFRGNEAPRTNHRVRRVR